MAWLELKTSLEHLPARKQNELTRAVAILHAEIDEKPKLFTQQRINASALQCGKLLV